jgi:predicted permease
LIAGGLLARSLGNMGKVNPGFEVERLVTFRMNATLSGYEPTTAPEAYLRLRDKLSALPGVRATGVAQVALLSDMNMGGGMKIEGCKAVDQYGNIETLINSVDAGYFRALQLPLLAGREFSAADHRQAPLVVVVNRKLERMCFGDESAVGRWMSQGSRRRQIVGVVKDSMHSTLRHEIGPFVYFPMTQANRVTNAFFYLRTAMPEAAVIGAAQRAVREFDANLAMLEPRTMREQINETAYNERLSAFLSAVFALLAVVLAAVGLYGVLAFMVTCRTREIGIRIALGAESRRVEWLVLREVLVLVGIGLAAGLPAAFALARVMKSLLYGLEPSDPAVFAGATALLVMAALAAGYWPARRAARVSPITALRYD